MLSTLGSVRLLPFTVGPPIFHYFPIPQISRKSLHKTRFYCTTTDSTSQDIQKLLRSLSETKDLDSFFDTLAPHMDTEPKKQILKELYLEDLAKMAPRLHSLLTMSADDLKAEIYNENVKDDLRKYDFDFSFLLRIYNGVGLHEDVIMLYERFGLLNNLKGETTKQYLTALSKVPKHMNKQLQKIIEAPRGSSQNPLPVTFKVPFWQSIFSFLVHLIGFVLICALVYVNYRGSGSGGFGDIFNKTPFSAVTTSDVVVTFADVKGNAEAKEELQDLVDFLKNPAKYANVKIPKGILMVGPPGTGKTLMARALAGEAGVKFLLCAGSEFEEVFVGVGAKRIRQLFKEARKEAPCIIFIDEIDAVGSSRHTLQKSTSMTLNQLLVELDGFNPSDGVCVMVVVLMMVVVVRVVVIVSGDLDRSHKHSRCIGPGTS
eukprot:TRINITY_DN2912_c0_g1_i10.p1 TRINITY_DN2912_c0_g1~~TRINITY_DN2912_c0_g1_i10.p1  ORF type:complete len:431 (-),score=86.36 TRINITY_DN2912_c0_g1_i10:668-1960(-)